jgi:hypothetical protein
LVGWLGDLVGGSPSLLPLSPPYLHEDAVLVEGEELPRGEGVELWEEEGEGRAVPRELLVLPERLLFGGGDGGGDTYI